MRKETIVIPTPHGRSIAADITYDDQQDHLPIVIFCHGYKGFKDWGAWGLVAEAFARAGFCFLKFNFSYNGGTIEQPIDFPDLEAFGQNTFSREIDDIGSVLDYISTDCNINGLDTTSISLIGHSRGGGMATIKASIDKRIQYLITWAGIAEIERRFPQGELMEQWQRDGIRYITNSRTNQQMPHYLSFYEDFIANKALLNIESACKNLKIPHLIINGTLDKAVRTEEAQLMKNWNPNAQLIIIPKAGHTFGARHPWDKPELPYFLDLISKKTIEFIL